MAVNDDIYTYLARLGYSGAFNDKLYAHLTNEGFLQQSLTDKLAAAGGYKSYVLGSLLSDSIVGSLFYANEQGVWYDPNDLTTLYQDSAGTTPVTAAGQPVGLMLDKRLGLVRMAEMWAHGSVLYQNGATAVGVNHYLLDDPANAGASGVRMDAVLTVGKTYEMTLTILAVSGGVIRVTSGSILASSTASTGQFRCIVTAGSSNLLFSLSTNNGSAEIRDISVRELPGNHAFQPTAASRPMLRKNATTGAYYLETDGSDDWMSTAAIDFTGTDKVSVFTGVRKLSDAAGGMLCELSHDASANNEVFNLQAPTGTTATFRSVSKGTLLVANITPPVYAAPYSAVLSAALAISTDTNILRVNGATAASGAGDQGTGNFGNHPLYLFRRGGISLPFNGHFYGLIIVGRLCTDAETRNVERIFANKTGVVLV